MLIFDIESLHYKNTDTSFGKVIGDKYYSNL